MNYPVSCKDLMSLTYLFIFEYYDGPLTFIADINKQAYFFYIIDDNIYFMAELDKPAASILSTTRDLKALFDHLLNQNQLNILTIDTHRKTKNIDSTKATINQFKNNIPNKPYKITTNYVTHEQIPKNLKFEEILPFNTKHLNYE